VRRHRLEAERLGACWLSSPRRKPGSSNLRLDDREFHFAAGHIRNGGQAAVRFEIRGTVKAHPAIVIEHVTRLREDLRPDRPQRAQPGGSYRVEIVGEPSYAVDIRPTSRNGDHHHAAIVAAAGRIVNSIPAVIAAPPGIRTTLDLPLITGKGVYAAP
jgi:hypothetical protein